ncbi:hypothetical protein ACOMHN_063612 [Nucella lapillus]
MRDDQASNEGLLCLCRGGQPPPAKRARYVDSARKLQALKTELDNQQRTLHQLKLATPALPQASELTASVVFVFT